MLPASRDQALVRIGLLAVALGCAVFAPVRLATELTTGQPTPWWGNVVGLGLCGVLAGLHAWRPERTVDIAWHGMIAVALGALFLPVFYGMPSTLWWMALVPLGTAMRGARVGAFAWTVVVVVLVGIGSTLDPSWIVEDAAGETSLEALLSRFGFVATLVGVGIGFKAEVDARARELERTAEELRAANAARNRFLANMSHELRTPLHGVLALTELTLADDLTAEQRERLEASVATGRLLHRLLDDLLEVSRNESVERTLAAERFALRQVVRDALEPVASQARSRGLRFGLAIDEQVADRRTGDPVRLAQILSNLSTNAVKFTPAGSVEVRVSGADDVLQLDVVDTGPGIPPADRVRVFEPFAQLDTPTDGPKGAGLGLAIVAELVQLMDGRIAVVDAPAGTHVTATLRIPAAEEEEAAVPVATRALRVLVAEDEPTNQVVVRAFLARLGHVATIVPDGLAALEALEDDVFDVVVTDLRMPRLDGAGLLRALRDRGTDHRVVLCTAEAGPDERALLDDLGADALLEKPFTLEGLASALRR